MTQHRNDVKKISKFEYCEPSTIVFVTSLSTKDYEQNTFDKVTQTHTKCIELGNVCHKHTHSILFEGYAQWHFCDARMDPVVQKE